MPVFGTIAARFNDDGVTALYQSLLPRLVDKGLKVQPGRLPRIEAKQSSGRNAIVPPQRVRYLACAIWPRSPIPCAATTATSGSSAASPANASSFTPPGACWKQASVRPASWTN
ncbi:MAG: methylmalonyl-CoA mutase [Proteobacteria bacterium]|nr:methylmalonyl-CoA mutase [Pseudomonadota bacterium]